MRPDTGCAAAWRLTSVNPAVCEPVASTATAPEPTMLDQLVLNPSVVTIEPARVLPAPDPVPRIGSNAAQASTEELNAALRAALEHSGPVPSDAHEHVLLCPTASEGSGCTPPPQLHKSLTP